MKQRYGGPTLYDDGTVSITLEPGPTEIMWVLAIRGPSTERPGGSVVRRIIVDQTEICTWLAAVWNSDDPPDYKALYEAANAVVAQQAEKVDDQARELTGCYQRMALDEQLRISKNALIEQYKAEVVRLTAQVDQLTTAAKPAQPTTQTAPTKPGGFLSWLRR
jgi:hypothetical protein